MSDEVKVEGQWLLDNGVIQEINRRVLHKRGLALAVEVGGESDGECHIRRTDDPAGYNFLFDDEDKARAKYVAFNALLVDIDTRYDELGYMVQPLP